MHVMGAKQHFESSKKNFYKKKTFYSKKTFTSNCNVSHAVSVISIKSTGNFNVIMILCIHVHSMCTCMCPAQGTMPKATKLNLFAVQLGAAIVIMILLHKHKNLPFPVKCG